MTTTVSTLTKQERSELSRLEGVVGQGFDGFRRVGEALARIAEAKLYRGAYRDFTSYLRDRWQLGPAHAYRLITASEVAGSLPGGDDVPPPGSEKQCRALARLDDPELRQDAWERAVAAADPGQPTAAQVEAAVDLVEAEALEELSADVVASLSPEAQAEVFRDDEERDRMREKGRKRQEKKTSDAKRRQRAFDLVHKLGRLTKDSGPDLELVQEILCLVRPLIQGKTALALHDQYVRELETVQAAA